MAKTPEQLEHQIKEQRTIEATKKNLVGPNGKLGAILKTMGQPIISHNEGGAYVDSYYLDDPLAEDDEIRRAEDFLTKVPTIDMNSEQPTGNEWGIRAEPISYGIYEIGKIFDGLSRGMHLEIKYTEETAVLICTWKGYIVYRECKGDLTSYVPGKDWEDCIDRLYTVAKRSLRELKEVEFKENVQAAEKEKKSWLDSLRERWGI